MEIVACLEVKEEGRKKVCIRTFLSLFFSAVSSLPALADCRFNCFAVN